MLIHLEIKGQWVKDTASGSTLPVYFWLVPPKEVLCVKHVPHGGGGSWSAEVAQHCCVMALAMTLVTPFPSFLWL